MKRIEHNVETSEIIQIQLTDAEIAQYQTEWDKAAEENRAKESELAAKEAARQAILDKLGITAEEAKLLLS
jgi:hypothetical protein